MWELKVPQTDQQGLSELWEIKYREGDTAWELMQRFKDAISKLGYTLDPNHQRDWFIKALFLLTRTLLTQQKIGTLKDALEKASRIEAMVGYPYEYRGGTSLQDPMILGLQSQIVNMTEKLRDLQPIRPARPNV